MTKMNKNFWKPIASMFAVGLFFFFTPGNIGQNVAANQTQGVSISSIVKNISVGVVQSAQTFNVDSSVSGTNLAFAPAKKVELFKVQQSPAPTPVVVPTVPTIIPQAPQVQQPVVQQPQNPVQNNNNNQQQVTPPPVGPSKEPGVPYDASKVDPKLAILINRESGGNLHAVSGSGQHFGLGQLLDGHYRTYLGLSYYQVQDNADLQIEAMLGYIYDRYGSIDNALNHSYQFGWY